MAISPIANKDPAARTKLNDVIAEVNAAAVANQTEVNGGTDNAKRVTSLTLETRRLNRRANQTLVNQGTDDDQWVSSLKLEGKFVAKAANQSEVNAGAAVVKYVPPDVMEARRLNRKASQLEVVQGTEGDKWVSPLTLQGKVDVITLAIASDIAASMSRPGAMPSAYTDEHLGGTNGTASGTSIETDRGIVRRITGDVRLTLRERFPVISGLSWHGTVILQRRTNPTNPSGETIEVQVVWLESDGTIISAVRAFPAVEGTPLTVADGIQIVDFTFGGADTDRVAPPGATDAAISVRSFGSDGVTDVEVVTVERATSALLTGAADAAKMDVLLANARPGASPDAFTNEHLGGVDGTVDGISVSTSRGVVRRITGDGRCTTRRRYPVLSGITWRATVVLQRTTNPSDPAGDQVEVQVVWINAAGSIISANRAYPQVDGTPLYVADGVQVVDFTFGGAGSFRVAPDGAVDAVISVRTFGSDGVTDVEVIAVDRSSGAHTDAIGTERPGAYPSAYTNSQLGGTSSVADGVSVETSRGLVRRLTGSSRLTYRKRVPVISGLSWTGSVVLQRTTNPTDPSGDEVEVQVVWINSSGGIIKGDRFFPTVNGTPLKVNNGVQVIEWTFGGATTDKPAPSNAVDATISVRTFGSDGVTDVEVMKITSADGLLAQTYVEDAIEAEAAIRAAAIARALAHSNRRPGLNPDTYTNTTTGGTGGTADGVGAVNTRGAVRRLTGDARLTLRDRIPVLTGMDWQGTVHLSRYINPSDPSGDSAEVHVNWLNSSGSLVSSQRAWPAVSGDALTVADGAQRIVFTFGGDDMDFAKPQIATDAVISVRTFGADGVTDVEVVQVEPASGPLSYQRVKALELVDVGYLGIDPGVVEHGETATPTLRWTTEGTATLKQQRIVPGYHILDPDVREWTEPDAIDNDRTYTLILVDNEGRQTAASIKTDFRHRMFWGTSAEASLDAAGILALQNSELVSSASRTVYLDASAGYIYIAWPDEIFGEPIFVGIDEVAQTDALVVTTVEVVTPGGLTMDYRVLRSAATYDAENIRVEILGNTWVDEDDGIIGGDDSLSGLWNDDSNWNDSHIWAE